ncbi:MAG: LytTR family DNA-binding domain-containing protein [Saonia sp.]
MLGILNKPHPFIFNHFSVIIPSVITFLIIVIFAPSHFQDLGLTRRWIAALITALFVAACIMMSVSALKKLLPNAMNEDDWTIGKEILLISSTVLIVCIAISTLLLIVQDNRSSVVSLIIKTASITMGISIFPIIIMILFEQYHHQKLQFKKAEILTEALTTENQRLKTKDATSTENIKKLLIRSENQNIELRLDSEDLVYMRSDGNYIEVYYSDMEEIKTKLIRNRLKSFESMLPNTVFLRCHKSFIVNANYIIKVEGNARNLELKLKGIAMNIPVSRAKVKEVSQFLEA